MLNSMIEIFFGVICAVPLILLVRFVFEKHMRRVAAFGLTFVGGIYPVITVVPDFVLYGFTIELLGLLAVTGCAYLGLYGNTDRG